MRKPNSPSQAELTLFDAGAQAPLPVAPLDDAQRLACLRLIRSENVGPVTFRELINHFGGAAAALEALPELGRRTRRRRPLRLCPRPDAEAELAAASRVGAVPIFTIEPGYPPALAHIPVPPPLLYAKGRTELLMRPAVAIVGSRNASAAGVKLARQLASALGFAGLLVVSGLARGIDGAAHEAALATGTVAVLAGGVDHVYPPEHAGLHERIATDGCLVSEMPPGFQPRGQDFPRRNRIISGMSHGVVIVEAARRSGTLITARTANEQGRLVFAVPGHPLDPRAEGTNALLKQGALIVTQPDDVLDAMRPLMPGPHDAHRFAEAPAPAPGAHLDATPAYVATVAPSLPDDALIAQVQGALGPAPIDVDEIARATGLPARAVRIAVLELDLAGLIEHHGGQLVSLRTHPSA
ncbi:MAG: DNA-processing protein DprA [Hyphomicrobiaceae bacterium]